MSVADWAIRVVVDVDDRDVHYTMVRKSCTPLACIRMLTELLAGCPIETCNKFAL